MPTTQTVTYDPTNDSIIEEQNEARDAENLEIGTSEKTRRRI